MNRNGIRMLVPSIAERSVGWVYADAIPVDHRRISHFKASALALANIAGTSNFPVSRS